MPGGPMLPGGMPGPPGPAAMAPGGAMPGAPGMPGAAAAPAGALAPGRGGAGSPGFMPSGTPAMPKMSQEGSSRPSMAAGTEVRGRLWTLRQCTTMALEVFIFLPHSGHLKCFSLCEQNINAGVQYFKQLIPTHACPRGAGRAHPPTPCPITQQEQATPPGAGLARSRRWPACRSRSRSTAAPPPWPCASAPTVDRQSGKQSCDAVRQQQPAQWRRRQAAAGGAGRRFPMGLARRRTIPSTALR